MCRCERWTIKKGECWKAFELWCRRRLLRVPWTVRRSNQSILKKINTEMFNVHLMWRADLLVKTLMLGKVERKRRRGWQRWWHLWLNGREFEQTLGDRKGQGRLVCCCPLACKELDMTERLNSNNRRDKEGHCIVIKGSAEEVRQLYISMGPTQEHLNTKGKC